MGAAGRLLILSATEFEVAPLLARLSDSSSDDAWPHTTHGLLGGLAVTLVSSGIGKVNCAAALVAAASAPPSAVLQVGVAGAYPGAGLAPGAVVVAHSEFDLDLGVGRGAPWQGVESIGLPALPGSAGNRLQLDAALVAAVSAAADARPAAFATSDTVTADRGAAAELAARHGLEVESMEGVAAAQVSARLGLPFAELRAISNVVGDRDRADWSLEEAITAVCLAAERALPAMLRWLPTTA